MNRYICGVLFIGLLMLSSVVKASDDLNFPPPADTKLSLQLLSPISTATNKKGDTFSCKVVTPMQYAGAIVEGHIRGVKRSGKAGKESKIDLAFDKITMPNGLTAEFAASVVEVFDNSNVASQGRADNEGTLSGRSIKVKTKVKRAVAGAIIGGIVGGIVGGGQGAAVGAAIGAGVGVTTTIAAKCPDLEFGLGTQLTVQVNGPRDGRRRH
jgi:hypothetical protein